MRNASQFNKFQPLYSNRVRDIRSLFQQFLSDNIYKYDKNR